MHTGIRKRTALRDRLVLQIRRPQICKSIAARIVVVLIFPDIRPEVEDRVRSDRASISRCDIKRANLRTLIGVTNIREDRIRSSSATDHVLHIQVVEGIWRLKPRTAVVQIEMDRVDSRKLAVDAIKDVDLIPLIMKDSELRRIEKASGVQTV